MFATIQVIRVAIKKNVQVFDHRKLIIYTYITSALLFARAGEDDHVIVIHDDLEKA
jgi:hypothetical protein